MQTLQHTMCKRVTAPVAQADGDADDDHRLNHDYEL